TEDFADATPSPLDDAVSSDFLERYERAQSQLSEEERLLLHLRLELDFSYDEIAAMTDRPSGDAVRKGVRRSIRKLAEVMSDERWRSSRSFDRIGLRWAARRLGRGRDQPVDGPREGESRGAPRDRALRRVQPRATALAGIRLRRARGAPEAMGPPDAPGAG